MSQDAQSQIQEAVKSARTTLVGFLEKNDQVNQAAIYLEQKTNVAKEILLVAIMLIPVALILIRGQGNFLIDLVGFVYPAVKSIKLVDSGKTEGESMWITYWMIFSFLKVIEGFLDFFVMNIPFYPFGKAAFLVWCYHPSTRGAETVYSSVIKPHIVPLIVEVKKD